MQTIYKYDVLNKDWFELELPKNARILTMQEQFGNPKIWAIVDTEEKETEKRLFRLAGTGHPLEIQTGFTYIGTCNLLKGALIFHLFEVER